MGLSIVSQVTSTFKSMINFFGPDSVPVYLEIKNMSANSDK